MQGHHLPAYKSARRCKLDLHLPFVVDTAEKAVMSRDPETKKKEPSSDTSTLLGVCPERATYLGNLGMIECRPQEPAQASFRPCPQQASACRSVWFPITLESWSPSHQPRLCAILDDPNLRPHYDRRNRCDKAATFVPHGPSTNIKYN